MEKNDRTSNRGQKWTREEVKCLIQIWSDDCISEQLLTTHKNTVVYSQISKRLQEMGFLRSVSQCRIKAKKLRHEYVKVRNALNKSDSSGREKDRFLWYNEMDKILGTKPVLEPVDIVESYESSTPSSASTETSTSDLAPVSHTDVDGLDFSHVSCDTEATPANEDASANQSTETRNTEESTRGGRLPIPGARARKRKAKSCRQDEDFKVYMAENRKMLEEMLEAEKKQLTQEANAFERMLQAQQEAEERRFQAMQAQQQATNQMFMQLMSTLVSALNPDRQSSPISPWMTKPTPTSTPNPLPTPPPHQHPSSLHEINSDCMKSVIKQEPDES